MRKQQIVRSSSATNFLGTWDNRLSLPLDADASNRYGMPIPKVSLNQIGVKSEIGRRSKNEDRFRICQLPNDIFYAAVFDGHSGAECAEFACSHLDNIIKQKFQLAAAVKSGVAFEELVRESILYVNSQFNVYVESNNPAALPSGSTCTVCIVRESTQLIVAHVGDSRALFSRRGQPVRLTNDHVPDRQIERERIEKCGGKVMQDVHGRHLVQGRLSMSRSLGHPDLQKAGVTADPDIRKLWIQHHRDAFLVLMTDGVTSVMPDEEVHAIVSNCTTPEEAAKSVVESALCFGSDDNCTAIVIPLPAWRKYSGSLGIGGFGRSLMQSYRFS